MSEGLYHYGILGQKWGVRRTPAELGHAPSGENGKASDEGETKNEPPRKTPGLSAKKASTMSDDELRQRIARMNMEEQYENLVARRNAKSISTTKKLLAEAAENLGRKALGIAVDSLVTKMSNKGDKGDKFDINDFKNADVNGMDAETIAKVAKWYQNANTITMSREKMKASNTPPPKDGGKEK